MKNNNEDMVTKKEFKCAIAQLVTKTEFRERFGGLDKTVGGLQVTVGGLQVAVGDLQVAVGDLQVAVGDLQVAVRRLEETMVTKAEFGETIGSIKETMYTKADHAKFMVWMDEAMTELQDSRDERKLSERQVLRIDDIVFDHEKRIRVLEKK